MPPKTRRQSASGLEEAEAKASPAISSSPRKKRGRPAKPKQETGVGQKAAVTASSQDLLPSPEAVKDDSQSEASSLRQPFQGLAGDTVRQGELFEKRAEATGCTKSPKKKPSGIKLKLKFGPIDSGDDFQGAVEPVPSLRLKIGQDLSNFPSSALQSAQKPRLQTPDTFARDYSQPSSLKKSALSPAPLPKRSSLVKTGSPAKPKNTPVRFASPVVSAEYIISASELISRPSTPTPRPQVKRESLESGIYSTTDTLEGDSFHTNHSEPTGGGGQERRKRRKLKRRQKESPSKMSNVQTPSSAVLAQHSQSQQNRYQSYESFDAIPPQLFDIIPRTERLLSRILVPDQGIGAAASLDVPDHKRPLDIKDLDSAANGIMVQIQKARAAVSALPGVNKTIEEQEDEMEYLEERVRKQREMLKNLRDLMVDTSKGEKKAEDGK